MFLWYFSIFFDFYILFLICFVIKIGDADEMEQVLSQKRIRKEISYVVRTIDLFWHKQMKLL